MHCMSDETGSDYLRCNDCKECMDLTCGDCDFYSEKFGCSLPKCDFKYSDASKHQMKVAFQYDWE